MSSSLVHPTAIIHPTARLGADVRVGAFVIIEQDVELGEGCVVAHHAQILRGTVAGRSCHFGNACVIGGDPQAKGFDPNTPSRVVMGDENVIREHVTIHRSMTAGGETRMGHRNFLMAGCHLGHDVVMEDDCVLANSVLLAGHVQVGRRCFLGGGGGFHQFIRIGESAMVQGNASMSQDVPPFCVSAGLNTVHGLNSVGLKRQGHATAARLELKRAFDLIYRGRLNLTQAVEEARKQPWGPLAEAFVTFIENRGKKGVATLARDVGPAE